VRLNKFKLRKHIVPRTHEGAPAAVITPEQALRRTVLSCMLWESEFYEDGVQIAGRIHQLVPQVAAEKVAELAAQSTRSDRKKDWRRSIGVFRKDPDFEEAVRLGREYRDQQTYQKEIAGS